MTLLRKLDIKPESIESIYGYYRKRILLVNRKYQRKLVWTVSEKEKFIDSVFNGLPIPLILVAISKYKESTVYEIIDGMQRLNAVVSFLENEFTLNGKYFNLDTLAMTKKLKDDKIIVQKQPALSVEDSLIITSYQLPFSITSYEKESDIEEIFRRINSYGRRLSSHELRQAGSTGTFTRIVRTLSETIRQDISPSDKILLGNMRKISINNQGLDYGINLKDIFWYKQNILTENNIRASRDEELIAHLVIALLRNYDINISSTSLDMAYGLCDEENENFDSEELIKSYGGDLFIISQFEAIFQEVKNTLDCYKFNFRTLLFKESSKYINYAYQIIFLAFHRLLVVKELKINDYTQLNKELNGLGDKLITPNIDEVRHRAARNRCINSVVGVIEKHFSRRNENDPALSNGVVKLNSLLTAAKTENTTYDFKQGIYQMDKDSRNIRNKIIKTLCAFVNQGKGAVGYVVIGVADNEEMAKKHNEYYKSQYIKLGNFYVTGIDCESQKRHSSLDDYRTQLEQSIKALSIEPEYYKTQILKNIDLFTYNDKSIIILKIESKDDPLKFQGKFYHRLGTSTEEVSSSQEREIWSLFLK